MKRAASGAADRKAAEGKTTSFIMKDGKGSVKMKMMNAAGRMIQVPERPLEPIDARIDYREPEWKGEENE